MKRKILSATKFLSPGFLAWTICFNTCSAQCLNSKQFWDKIITIENSDLKNADKLSQLIKLKKDYNRCRLRKDSVYARLLHRIGVIENNSMSNAPEAIINTLEAVSINTSGKPGACLRFAASSYYNLGWYYKNVFKLNEAIAYFDSSIILNNKFSANSDKVMTARLQKGNMYFNKGNFESDIQETSMGLSEAEKINDSVNAVSLLLERAEALIAEEKLTNALNDINKAILYLKFLNPDDYFDNRANALQYKVKIIARQGDCREAINLYNQSLQYRKIVDTPQTAIDYSNAAVFLLHNCSNSLLAKKYCDTAYSMGLKYNNNNACMLAAYFMGEISFKAKNYKLALLQYNKAITHLFPLLKAKYSLNNPPYKEFSFTNLKSNAEQILNAKSKCLLYLYKQTRNSSYLLASINTARLNDSVITDLRHEQTGEQNKLYWRNDTREFFTNAIEACYLDQNAEDAFYFMEKSRSVLLNDKLNELGASADLPEKEETKKQSLVENIILIEKKLSLLNDSAKAYYNMQQQLFTARETFDRFIHSLERKYPAYYQYKYADEMPSMQKLQEYLKKNNQSFIHYFFGDTVSYILAISSNKTKMLRLTQKNFSKEQLIQFLQFCTNKEKLNSNYASFAALSNSIYKKIFQPLQLSTARVVICSDNIVIPFDALCTDAAGKNYLLNNNIFSYVYSARFLMKHFDMHKAEGNFLGFAPVSYASYLGVHSLGNAGAALIKSSSFYNDDKLFVEKTATRNNFFKYISHYSVVNIFSHASADTTEAEPVLFMQDSLIHLSELQSLNDPATKLVLLSACQTNVGKNATGEGIYSLARGFATAGIPSVSATLWKADEQTIYAVSEKFNEYLSQGMDKDEALQKAKLYFIQNNSSDKSLPYYWANMILIGNTDALTAEANKPYNYIWIIVIAVLLATGIFFLLKRKMHV